MEEQKVKKVKLTQEQKTQYLNSLMDRSPFTRQELADKLGLSRYGLSMKTTGVYDFWAKEVSALSKVLGLTRDQEDMLFFDR